MLAQVFSFVVVQVLPLRLNAEQANKDNVDLCIGNSACVACSMLCVACYVFCAADSLILLCLRGVAVFRVRDTSVVGRFADDVTLGGLQFDPWRFFFSSSMFLLVLVSAPPDR